MTHISRPLQIALAAMALFVAVWFVALRGHSNSGESAGSSASAGSQAPTPAKPAASAPSSSSGNSGSSSSAGGGSIYHGPAPGVEGLSRAIAKARGAVAQSQQNAKQLQEKSAQASSPASTTSSTTASATSTGASASKSPSHAAPARGTSASNNAAPAAGSASRGAPAQQTLVEGELEHGQTVILLFWDPAGSVDVAVHHDLQALQAGHAARIAVHYASAHEVAQFGSLTRSLQVNQTPTMLVIAPGGNTKTLTGLADPYTIQQAISEARHS